MPLFRMILSLVACLILGGLTGCGQPTQNQTRTSAQPEPRPSTTSPSLGSYNLQKRHGLGGWDRATGPSEKAWLQQMEQAGQPAPSHFIPERKPH